MEQWKKKKIRLALLFLEPLLQHCILSVVSYTFVSL